MPPRPRSLLVSSDLVLRLQSGEWRVGDKFPTVDELKDNYEFSRGTVFKGIQQLVDEGFLTVQKGVGTYVARTVPLQNVGLLIGESCLHPQKTPLPYVLGEKLVSSLTRNNFSVMRFIERAGDELPGGLAIEDLADALKKRSLRGMIMTNCNLPSVMDESELWQEYGVPFVTIATIKSGNFEINFDSTSMVKTALQYFADHHRKRIGLVASEATVSKAKKMASALPGLQIMPQWTFTAFAGNYEQAGFQWFSTQLQNSKDLPDALFVSDDIVTKGIVQATLQHGVKIPEELLIIHGANSDTDVFYPVQMPKIEYDLDEIVGKSINMLKCAIANASHAGKKMVESIVPHLMDVQEC